eukprot:1628738-Prymnesium_polylepis.1
MVTHCVSSSHKCLRHHAIGLEEVAVSRRVPQPWTIAPPAAPGKGRVPSCSQIAVQPRSPGHGGVSAAAQRLIEAAAGPCSDAGKAKSFDDTTGCRSSVCRIEKPHPSERPGQHE